MLAQRFSAWWLLAIVYGLELALLTVNAGAFQTTASSFDWSSWKGEPLVLARGYDHYYRLKGDGDDAHYFQYASLMVGGSVDRVLLERRWGTLPGQPRMLPERIHGPLLPYRDFVVEYPPVNIPFILLPRLLTNKVETYCSLFAWQMVLLHLASLGMALLLARALGVDPRQVLVGCVLAAPALGHVLTSRLDPIVTCFVLAALVAAVRRRATLCAVALSLAAGAKLWPVILPRFF